MSGGPLARHAPRVLVLCWCGCVSSFSLLCTLYRPQGSRSSRFPRRTDVHKRSRDFQHTWAVLSSVVLSDFPFRSHLLPFLSSSSRATPHRKEKEVVLSSASCTVVSMPKAPAAPAVRRQPTSVSLSRLRLVSPNPAPLCAPSQWQLVLSVEGSAAPREAVDVRVSLIVDPGKAPDVVLDELEVGPLALGLNALALDIDGPRWRDVEAYAMERLLGLLVSLRYKGREFLSVGCPVRVFHRSEGETGAGGGAAALPETVEKDDMRRAVQTQKLYVNPVEIEFDEPLAAAAAAAEEEEEEEEEEEDEEEDDDEEEEEDEESGDAEPPTKTARHEGNSSSVATDKR